MTLESESPDKIVTVVKYSTPIAVLSCLLYNRGRLKAEFSREGR